MSNTQQPVETVVDNQNDDDDDIIWIFITAHPDDETMFMLPTLVNTTKTTTGLLCLTTGNYDPDRKDNSINSPKNMVRIKELEDCCRLLFLQIEYLEIQNLPDHPVHSWDRQVAMRLLSQGIERLLSRMVGPKKIMSKRQCMIHFLTFDEGGVSGHINHCDTFRVVRDYYFANYEGVDNKTAMWVLQTERNLLRKYVPVYDWFGCLFCFLCHCLDSRSSSRRNSEDVFSVPVPSEFLSSTRMVFRLWQPWLNWKAMKVHLSQFVWYRRLFVIFSCYTYVNVWQRVVVPIEVTTANRSKQE